LPRRSAFSHSIAVPLVAYPVALSIGMGMIVAIDTGRAM
jgi:hypothetical protein